MAHTLVVIGTVNWVITIHRNLLCSALELAPFAFIVCACWGCRPYHLSSWTPFSPSSISIVLAPKNPKYKHILIEKNQGIWDWFWSSLMFAFLTWTDTTLCDGYELKPPCWCRSSEWVAVPALLFKKGKRNIFHFSFGTWNPDYDSQILEKSNAYLYIFSG